VFLRCRRAHQRDLKPAMRTAPRKKKGWKTESLRSRPKTPRYPKMIPEHSHVGVKPYKFGQEWRVKDMSTIAKPLAWVRRDANWFIGLKDIHRNFRVPYLDNLGCDTGEQLYSWVTTLPSFVASYISTRLKRVRVEISKDKHIRRKNKRGLIAIGAKISILSFIIGNDYYIQRFKALLRKKQAFRVLNAMVRNLVSKFSDDKWFLYRHICSQIKWLDLRGSRMGQRDKLKVLRSLNDYAVKHGRSLVDRELNMYNTLYSLALGRGYFGLD